MRIREIEAKSIMTKSNLPVADFSVNPYVGCAHACKYCYASFMKRFTNHPELDGLYRAIYAKKDRAYWSELDARVRRYAEAGGFPYVRDDDSRRSDFGELPVIVNYFYHEEIVRSAKKAEKG